MRTKASVSIILCALLLTGLGFAQRGAGSAGGGAGQQGMQGMQRQGSASTAGQRSGIRMQDQIRQQQRDRLRSQLTTQQRDQYREMNQTMERLRIQTRDMARNAAGSGFNTDQARQQQSQIREEFRSLQHMRSQLMNGLNSEQHAAVQERAQNMHRLNAQIENRLGNVDKDLSSSTPNRKRVQEEARAAERDMRNYHHQFRQMANELGMTSN
jgi:predicted  nucleic acid-binding Zn-ribbon protein